MLRYNDHMDTEKPSARVPDDLKLTHDGYFQETFKAKRFAKAFLKKTLPKKTIDCLELDGLTIEGRHVGDDMFHETIADTIYRIPISGTDEYVNFFVVIEHKSYQDYLTIFQLWGYVYGICLQDVRLAQKREGSKADYRLPPVVAIIVHHGESKFQGVTELSALFRSLPGLEDYLPRMQAILFDLNRIADDDPVLNDPAVPELKVVLMVLKLVFRQDVALKIQDVLRELKPYSDDPPMRRLIRATWVYLTNNAKHLKQNFEILLGTFEEVVGEKVMSTMVEIWKAEGKVEGRAEGKAEAGRSLVLTALQKKFKKVPNEIEAAVLAMSDPIALKSVLEHVFDCDTLEEFATIL